MNSEWQTYLGRVAAVLVCSLFFTAATAVGQGIPQSLPSYFLRTWQTENGLPHNAVTAIVQTRDGYLWLGTYDGLARFDGNSFTVFDTDKSNTPELRNNRVTTLFEDDFGNLWIGHESGELTRYRAGKFEAVEVNRAWETRRFLGISADRAGKLWLLNGEGRLASLDGEVVTAPNGGVPNKVSALVRDGSGALSVLNDGALFRFEENRFVPVELSKDADESYVTGIAAARDNGLWVVSDNRIRKWDGRTLRDDIGPAPWGPGSVTAALETKSGCLAVGTLESGLYLVFPGRGVLHFDREKGLPHDWVRSLYEDREGTLWAGAGSGGLVALRSGNVSTVNPPDRWQGCVVLSVCAARDGGLWAGTEGGGLYRFHNDQWTRFGESNGLANVFVWSVSQDSKGRIWAGTWGGGIYVQYGDRFERPPGLEDINVPAPAILHTASGVTWLGTADGLLRYADGNIQRFGRKDELIMPDVRSVVEEPNGRLWFGMLGGGLGKLENGVVTQYRKKDGLSTDYVQCLHLDNDGALWIGTYGGGLNRLKDGHFSSIGAAQGLPNNFICYIDDDGRGNLWFSSHGGIFRIKKSELNQCAERALASVQALSFGKGEGMPTLECSGGLQPSGCKTMDGQLWVPTSKGLVTVDASGAEPNPSPPPVVIEQMLVNGRPVEIGAGNENPLRIDPGRKRLDFRYTALTFVSPEKVRFRYRLEGLDEEWADAGLERTKNYSYIPPGNYTFRVQACNSDGVWNEGGASRAFVVQPNIWQRWWFRVVEGIVAAALLAGVVLALTRRRMRLKLERLERQRAVERERSRIAQDIHDNLGASLTRISLLSQSAHAELDNLEHAATQLDRIYSTAHDLTRALDEIVWAVNPEHDTLDSLANYLGKFAQDFVGPLGIRCRLDMPLDLPAMPVTAEVRHNIFLAFKEALNNVVKHAGATEVCVSLKIENDVVTLAVRDNGKGFKPETANGNGSGNGRIHGGNGLLNMRRRLQKVGGMCQLKSAPGLGAEATFIVTTKAMRR